VSLLHVTAVRAHHDHAALGKAKGLSAISILLTPLGRRKCSKHHVTRVLLEPIPSIQQNLQHVLEPCQSGSSGCSCGVVVHDAESRCTMQAADSDLLQSSNSGAQQGAVEGHNPVLHIKGQVPHSTAPYDKYPAAAAKLTPRLTANSPHHTVHAHDVPLLALSICK
jgi:hypothetical protein